MDHLQEYSIKHTPCSRKSKTVGRFTPSFRHSSSKIEYHRDDCCTAEADYAETEVGIDISSVIELFENTPNILKEINWKIDTNACKPVRSKTPERLRDKQFEEFEKDIQSALVELENANITKRNCIEFLQKLEASASAYKKEIQDMLQQEFEKSRNLEYSNKQLYEENLILFRLKAKEIPLSKRWHTKSQIQIDGCKFQIFNHIRCKTSPYFPYLTLMIRKSDSAMMLRFNKDLGFIGLNHMWQKYSEFIVSACEDLTEKEKLDKVSTLWCAFLKFHKKFMHVTNSIGAGETIVKENYSIFTGHFGFKDWEYRVDYENLEKSYNIFDSVSQILCDFSTES